MDATPAPSSRRAGRAARGLRVVAVGSVVWLAVLLGDHVDVAAADPGRTGCGSLPTVLRTQSGFRGGEVRTDQDAFDRRCIESARLRLEMSVVPALGLVGSAVALVALRDRRRPEARVLRPFA